MRWCVRRYTEGGGHLGREKGTKGFSWLKALMEVENSLLVIMVVSSCWRREGLRFPGC